MFDVFVAGLKGREKPLTAKNAEKHKIKICSAVSADFFCELRG
jgi:hypothetical protein